MCKQFICLFMKIKFYRKNMPLYIDLYIYIYIYIYIYFNISREELKLLLMTFD